MVISTEGSMERNFRITNNNAIDMHVGKRVRLRRTLLGMSQEQLGTELNITSQQGLMVVGYQPDFRCTYNSFFR